MAAPKLLESLPQLVAEGLISADQAERIRTRYGADPAKGSDRMLIVFAVLGSLLVGMGIILIVAHNWDDMPRMARTVLAFLPVLLGQGLVWFALQRKQGIVGWREGSAVLLACGLCACVALISQIYHINGELQGYLFTCCMLMAPLLYLPGSYVVAMVFLAMVTWYGCLVHWDNSTERPWLMIPLVLVAVPFYLRRAKENGMSIGFWWLSLAMALAVGIGTQLFNTNWEPEHALGLVAISAVFTLVPWLHRGTELRTWPWVFVGGATMLITFFVFSFRDPWDRHHDDGGLGRDAASIIAYALFATIACVLSIRWRKPFDRWPYPEGWWLFLICYGVGLASPSMAAILTNVSLLAVGVLTIKQGTERDSLTRMNLGLAILSITIIMRFFDTNMGFAVRGLVFIVIGCGFLYMNVHMVRKRDRDRSRERDETNAS